MARKSVGKVLPAPRKVSSGSVSRPSSPTKGKPRFESNPATGRVKAPL